MNPFSFHCTDNTKEYFEIYENIYYLSLRLANLKVVFQLIQVNFDCIYANHCKQSGAGIVPRIERMCACLHW